MQNVVISNGRRPFIQSRCNKGCGNVGPDRRRHRLFVTIGTICILFVGQQFATVDRTSHFTIQTNVDWMWRTMTETTTSTVTTTETAVDNNKEKTIVNNMNRNTNRSIDDLQQQQTNDDRLGEARMNMSKHADDMDDGPITTRIGGSNDNNSICAGAAGTSLPPSFVPSELVPIEKLLSAAAPTYNCSDGQIKVTDKILPTTSITTHHHQKKIPKIIHLTSKSRCVPPFMMEHIQQNWRNYQYQNYSFIFWDDSAIHELFSLSVTKRIFPNLPKVVSCATSGATLSDLFRYLVLYLYGGIYSDVDNTVTHSKLDLEAIIQPNDTAFATIEVLGMPSQYFLAAAPGDPWMYHTLNIALDSLYHTRNVMVNRPHIVTGPRALKSGFIQYQQALNISTDGYVSEGVYVGDYFQQNGGDCIDNDNNTHDFINDSIVMGNGTNNNNNNTTTAATTNNNSNNHKWQIRLIGDKRHSKEYVDRDGLGSAKEQYFKLSNITHHIGIAKRYPGRNVVRCSDHIARQEAMWNGTKYWKANYKFINGTYVDMNEY